MRGQAMNKAADAIFMVAMIWAWSPAQADIQADKKVAARVFLEKMGKGDFSRVDEIYGPGFTAHSRDKSFSLEEDNASGKAIRSAVPDLSVGIERIIGEADLVAVHWRASGTNSVAAAGLPGSGKHINVQGMTFFRFEKGRIVQEWSITDELGMMRQLSVN
jgi:steroid delta-isomerase-like uncharacterized protein